MNSHNEQSRREGVAEAEPNPFNPASTRAGARASRVDWGAILTAVVAAASVAYLALENGGYDLIPRNEVGILVWWAALVAVVLGLLPVPGRTRAGLALLAMLAGYGGWTAAALEWTESAERTVVEVTRVATYLGFLVLGLALVTRRRDSARHLLGGLTLGIGFVPVLGAFSRLKIGWFPENELGTYLPGIEIERRLAYPLNYSSAVGIMTGMALPLLWAATSWPRSAVAHALAAAALPMAGLALFLTTSGGGAVTAVVGMAVLLVLLPDRIPKLLTLAAGTGGGAILAYASNQREALSRGLPSPAAEQQGNEVLLMAVIVCAAVAVFQLALTHILRFGLWPNWLRVSPSRARIATGIAILVAIPVALGAGAPDEASDAWETFKSRGGSTDAGPSDASTILHFSGSGRYQFWESAVEASSTSTLTGIGPGTFEFWWSRNGSYQGFVRDSHSLYMDSLAELGVVGLALIGAFVLAVLGIAVTRTLTAGDEKRVVLAAATAACAAFAFGAALDWIWEIAALPVAFMLLAAVAAAGFSRPDHGRYRQRRSRRRWTLVQRGVVAVVGLVAIGASWHALRGATAMEESRIAYADGDLTSALEQARDAADIQPYAATPRSQQALILESRGRLDDAAAAARQAASREETNWRHWLVLARIEARRGNLDPALEAYERVQRLNPRS